MNNNEKISINETLNVIRKAFQNENNENLNEIDLYNQLLTLTNQNLIESGINF